MPLTPGGRLGAYEIVAPLGAGGMGEVFRAHDTRLGRDVALKVLSARIAALPELLARFEREARTVAALNHPNIVVLHSIEEAEGVRFLTMELVEGETLDRLLAAGGLPVARVLELALPLIDALAAAHARGVVHRDLKPANVMVTREGRLKVLDFGLAKVTTAEAGPASNLDATQAATVAAPISTAGQMVGTIPYMAPEQLRGEPVDPRTDLFALGVMLYELCTGRRPFTGNTMVDISSAILRDTPAPLTSLRADLPGELARIVARCLAREPRERYLNALELHNDLRAVQRALEQAASAPPSGTAGPPAAAAALDTTAAPSIAVLPFVNRSRDEEDEYFADGLADELMNVLARIRGLRVAARTSAFQFKGKNEDLAVIGAKLNVATLLEGSVRKSGTRVRISVQLVKVADGFQLWSETYDRTLEDIFAVQDDIAQAVVKELRTTLLGAEPDSKASGEVRAEVAAAARGRGTDPEAHRLFLQGRFLVNRSTKADFARGEELLRQALSIDPDFAQAWAYLSAAQGLQGAFGFVDDASALEGARAAARRALELAPDLAEAHLAVGMLQLWSDWDWAGAGRSLARALELAPGNAEALRESGTLAYALGRVDEAIAFSRRAVEQDPLNAEAYNALSRPYVAAGRYAEAERTLRTALEISPGGVRFHLVLAIVLDLQGRRDEALAEALKETADWSRLTALAIVHHTGGRPAESDQALRDLIDRCADSAAVQIAQVLAVRGEADAAFDWLGRAFAQRDSGLAVTKMHPAFRGLHSDPRWAAFLGKMGLGD